MYLSFAKRRTMMPENKSIVLATAAVFPANALVYKAVEQGLHQFPILLVDAIKHSWAFYFPLDDAGIFQLLQVLGYGCLGNG